MPITLLIIGTEPRELLVFDDSLQTFSRDASNARVVQHPIFWEHLAAPALGTTPGMPSARTQVTFRTSVVSEARLIDHGACRVVVPWIVGPQVGDLTIRDPDPSVGGQLFPALHSQIVARAIEFASAADASISLQSASYAPVFFKGKTSDSIVDQDGFGFDDSFMVTKSIGYTLPDQVRRFRVQAHYKLDVDAGGPRLTAESVLVTGDLDAETQFAIDHAFRSELPPAMEATFKGVFSSELMKSTGEFLGCDPRDSSAIEKCRQIDGPEALLPKVNLALWAAAGSPSSPGVGGFTDKAKEIVTALDEDNYYCGATDHPEALEEPTNVCRFRPKIRRISVLPTGVEGVWYNADEPPTVDYQIVAVLKPDTAGTCGASPLPSSSGQAPSVVRVFSTGPVVAP